MLTHRARTAPLAALALVLLAGRAAAQCANPAIAEFGGRPGPVCSAGSSLTPQTNLIAVARGRFVSIESVPLVSGTPTVVGRVALDAAAVHMHTEISGRIWATDERTLYGIGVNGGPPTLLGRITMPTGSVVERVRVKGNFVYAISSSKLFIVDVTTPSAPVLRSTLTISPGSLQDLEVVGSYAYLANFGSGPSDAMVVVDVSNPLAPFEVRRVGNSSRRGQKLSKAPNLSGLYALSENATSGALELWSLSTASNPTLTAANATLSRTTAIFGELRVANTAALVLGDSALTSYDVGTLAPIGSPVQFSTAERVETFGLSTPYALVSRESGEVARVQFTVNPLAVVNPYIDVLPGLTDGIANVGEGVTVLSGPTDLWFFAGLPGAAPTPFGHLKPDAGFDAIKGPPVLISGGTLFATEVRYSPTTLTRILAYRVTGLPSPSVQFQGSYDVAGTVFGLAAGVDGNGVRRVYYTSGPLGGGSNTLYILNATNLGSMSAAGSFALTSAVGGPVRFLPASGSVPARVLVGGASNQTQIVSVASAAAPSSLGVIPSSSSDILAGATGPVWVLDRNLLRAYDISTPAVPFALSQTRIDLVSGYDGVSLARMNTAGTMIGVSTDRGDLVRIDATNPSATSVVQVASINSDSTYGPASLAFDGSVLHVANFQDGYTVLPTSFSAPPREDPNRTLWWTGARQGTKGICSGSPFTATARFVASPAVTSYRWQRLNPSSFVFEPMADGPTGTGSTVSGSATATLVINNPSAADATSYRCEATNSCGSEVTWAIQARFGGYANCDGSTTAPLLNAVDFSCFLQRYRSDGPSGFDTDYSNCDGSTIAPVLNAADFSCFLQQFTAGCQ